MADDDFDDGEMDYEGAQCCRCDLDLDPRSGRCPNDRCPFHVHYQDEIVPWSPPGEDEQHYIERFRSGEPHRSDSR
jgi:hypothetical protein